MFKVTNFADIDAYIAELYMGRRTEIRPYSYQFLFGGGNIAAGGVQASRVQLLANTDFLLLELRAPFSRNFELQMIDSASNERFFNDPVNLAAVTQNAGGSPGALAMPRWIAGNALIEATYENVTAGALNPGGFPLLMRGVNIRVFS